MIDDYNDELDAISKKSKELANVREERNAIIRAHLAKVDDEGAHRLIIQLGWALCEHLGTLQRTLLEGFEYEFGNQRFTTTRSEEMFAHSIGFHTIKNNYALLLIAQKELHTVVQRAEAKNSVPSFKKTYEASLKAILKAWEGLGVVLTYNDLIDLTTTSNIMKKFDDLLSFPSLWLTAFLRSQISLTTNVRLQARLERAEEVKPENELILRVLGEIAERRPDLRTYHDAIKLSRQVRTAVESEGRTDAEALLDLGLHPFSLDQTVRGESWETSPIEPSDPTDKFEEIRSKEDTKVLILTVKHIFSKTEWEVFILDIADPDNKPSLLEIAGKLGISEKQVSNCRHRYREKLQKFRPSKN